MTEMERSFLLGGPDEAIHFLVILVLTKMTKKVILGLEITMQKANSPDTDHRTVTLDPALSSFIENISRYFESYGIPRIGGRIMVSS